eukprot:SAG11_NODE_506_length_8881_cov_10.836825_4_plen_579_part_00
MDNVQVLDEIVVTRSLGGASVRMGRAGVFAGKSQLISTNTRIVVAWKGALDARPRGDTIQRGYFSDLRPPLPGDDSIGDANAGGVTESREQALEDREREFEGDMESKKDSAELDALKSVVRRNLVALLDADRVGGKDFIMDVLKCKGRETDKAAQSHDIYNSRFPQRQTKASKRLLQSAARASGSFNSFNVVDAVAQSTERASAASKARALAKIETKANATPTVKAEWAKGSDFQIACRFGCGSMLKNKASESSHSSKTCPVMRAKKKMAATAVPKTAAKVKSTNSIRATTAVPHSPTGFVDLSTQFKQESRWCGDEASLDVRCGQRVALLFDDVGWQLGMVKTVKLAPARCSAPQLEILFDDGDSEVVAADDHELRYHKEQAFAANATATLPSQRHRKRKVSRAAVGNGTNAKVSRRTAAPDKAKQREPERQNSSEVGAATVESEGALTALALLGRFLYNPEFGGYGIVYACQKQHCAVVNVSGVTTWRHALRGKLWREVLPRLEDAAVRTKLTEQTVLALRRLPKKAGQKCLLYGGGSGGSCGGGKTRSAAQTAALSLALGEGSPAALAPFTLKVM